MTSLPVKKLRDLWSAYSVELPDAAFAVIPLGVDVVLWRCRGCGFEFFNPAFTGEEALYQALNKPGYYCPTRPEFDRTVTFALRRRLKTVLDVGCGSGAFLDGAKSVGIQTFGLELNSGAAQQAQAKGHTVFACLLDQLPASIMPAGFDLVTLFQVIEHVSDPVSVLRQASARVRRGGYIALAAPSNMGVYRWLPFDPYQWPPHHVSRWRGADLRTLAKQCGLEVETIGADFLAASCIEQYLRFRSHTPGSASNHRGPDEISAAHKALIWLYRKAGMKFIAPRWGNSVFAFLRRV